MKRSLFFVSGIIFILLLCSCSEPENVENIQVLRAQSTLDSLYKYYGVSNSNLLRETYPFNERHKATYLASEEQDDIPNQYSYLWPYSGTLSAVNALYEATDDDKYIQLLQDKVLPGLEEYFDTKRLPPAYASYINSARESDRFYDDNIWLGIDFTDLYVMTGEKKYLDKAQMIWKFIESGTDEKLGGGIYWCEQKKGSKNACSNAPGAVFALKLFAATKDTAYFHSGKNLYEWTHNNLKDNTDNLIFDNINMEGKVDKRKYAYNSGQMIQAAALLYNHTGDNKYLSDAQSIARASYDHFFYDYSTSTGENFRLLKKGNIWFTAVMLRGFVELYNIDNERIYLDAFSKNLDYAWEHMRDANGLFNTDWSGDAVDESKWLLTQAAMAEMYARVAAVE